MKKFSSLLMASALAGMLTSCQSTIQDVNNVAGTANTVAGAANGLNRANNVSKAARKAGGVGKLGKLAGGSVPGVSVPGVPSLPGVSVPGVPGIPSVSGVSVPGVPGIPSVPGVSVPGVPKPAFGLPFGKKALPQPIGVYTGMSQGDLLAAAGRPNYKYAIEGEETWVYENVSFKSKKIKQTTLGLVPGVGSASTLLSTFNNKPAAARAAVTFNADGSVKTYSQIKDPSK